MQSADAPTQADAAGAEGKDEDASGHDDDDDEDEELFAKDQDNAFAEVGAIRELLQM